jgi:hypothetical protein
MIRRILGSFPLGVILILSIATSAAANLPAQQKVLQSVAVRQRGAGHCARLLNPVPLTRPISTEMGGSAVRTWRFLRFRGSTTTSTTS